MVGRVGFLGWFSAGRDVSAAFDAVPLRAEREAQFAVDANAIDPAVFGLEAYISPTAPAARIDRRSAMQVPAVKRCRDLIAGSLGTLPLGLYRQNGEHTGWALFEQPEVGIPRTVTLTRTFEDLLFEAESWWLVTEFGWHTYPTRARRIAPGGATMDDRGNVWIDGTRQDPAKVIRFESPNDGLLTAGARAIRTCLLLDAAAAQAAEGVPPVDYFTPADDMADPFQDETETATFLADWQTARRTRRTAWVPSAVKYNEGGWDPAKLQLAEQRQHAVLEIARVAGVDPEELGVSTTSRTYANQFDRRKAFLDFTLGGYRQAFEDRVSMTDVSPRGYAGRLDLDAFLRSDPLSQYQAISAGLEVGAILPEEVRPMVGRPEGTSTDGPGGPAEAPQPTATQTPEVPR